MSNTNCRVCGLDQGENPWGEDNKSPNFTICRCCGTEFGYDDFTLEGIKESRVNWINDKYKWFRPKYKPENWSAEEQMKNIPEEYL